MEEKLITIPQYQKTIVEHIIVYKKKKKKKKKKNLIVYPSDEKKNLVLDNILNF